MRNRRPVGMGLPRGSLAAPAQLNPAWSCDAPHGLEHAVHRRLRAQPGLEIASLVIRRIPNGVCLEGVLEGDSVQDVCNLARSVAGVDEVLNHLVVRQRTN